MIETLDADTYPEQFLQGLPIGLDRKIEHGHRVARARSDALQQIVIALASGNQHGFLRLGKAQLLERAQAIGIAIEYVEMGITGRLHAADSLFNEPNSNAGAPISAIG